MDFPYEHEDGSPKVFYDAIREWLFKHNRMDWVKFNAPMRNRLLELTKIKQLPMKRIRESIATH